LKKDTFLKINKKREKKIVPIIGITTFIDSDKFVVLAKNKNGYKQLLQILAGKFDWRRSDCTDLVVILTRPEQQALFSKMSLFFASTAVFNFDQLRTWYRVSAQYRHRWLF
jgi:hypothetical protein